MGDWFEAREHKFAGTRRVIAANISWPASTAALGDHAALHARGENCPDALAQMDFGPARTQNFACAACSENEKF